MGTYYSRSNAEQETTINFGRDEKGAEIWTTDLTQYTRLDKLCVQSPELYQCIQVEMIGNQIAAKKYRIADKSLITLRSKKPTGRTLTEEQRQQALINFSKKGASV